MGVPAQGSEIRGQGSAKARGSGSCSCFDYAPKEGNYLQGLAPSTTLRAGYPGGRLRPCSRQAVGCVPKARAPDPHQRYFEQFDEGGKADWNEEIAESNVRKTKHTVVL